MVNTENDRIVLIDGRFAAICDRCNAVVSFSTKNAAIKMLKRGFCMRCKVDYRSVAGVDADIYKKENKWCKRCSSCKAEQCYTRKEHAKQSFIGDWLCKNCSANNRESISNRPVGDMQRLFNKFKNSSFSRNIEWDLSIDEMLNQFTGKCALTGWDISIKYKNQTASLDRIDNSKGYTKDNIQWVHVMVNMCKNKYPQEEFIKMCASVYNNLNLH